MICPFAVVKLLPENATQVKITPRAVILHTAVDSSTPNSSLEPYFARGDVGVESHFYVMNNGTIEQYMDTCVMADANLNANSFAVSIETEDDGAPEQTPWTTAQLDSLVRLVSWLCDVHGVPRVLISSPTGSGIGWHAMWGAPSAWTPSAGKTCPGSPRIKQTTEIVIPRVAGQGEDFLSALADWEQRRLFEYVSDMVQGMGGRNEAGRQFVGEQDRITQILNELAALKADVAALKAHGA